MKIIKRSGLGAHQGKLRPVDESKMAEKKDIIRVSRVSQCTCMIVWVSVCKSVGAKSCMPTKTIQTTSSR